MKKLKQFVILLLTTVFIGASFNSFSSTEKENRKVPGFSAINVAAGIDLYLKMGDLEKVTIVADDDIIDDIITEVKDGVLKIYLKDKPFRWAWNKDRKAYVTVKQIEKIVASSGSDVNSENIIKSDELVVKASSGSDVKLEVEVNSLTLKTSSGSDAKLTGRAKNFNADASSGSDINASGLKTKNCRVEVSSGSDASVYVTGGLRARASSGGDIKYSGEPESVDVHESSGGDIYKR